MPLKRSPAYNAGSAHDKAARRKAIIQRVIGRMRQLALATCFDTLREHAKVSIRNRHSMRRVVQRLKRFSAARAVAAWAEWAVRQRRTRAVVQRVVARMRQLAVAGAFGQWLHHVCTRKANAASLRRAVQRMQGLATASALARWREYASSQRRTRAVVQRVVARIYAHSLAMSFSSWLLLMHSGRRRRHVGGMVVRRILLARRGCLSVIVATWRRRVSDRRRPLSSLLVVRRLLARLGTSTLASSWGAWMLWRVATRQARHHHESGCRDAARDASMLLGRVARLVDAELDSMVYEASMEHARVRMAQLERAAVRTSATNTPLLTHMRVLLSVARLSACSNPSFLYVTCDPPLNRHSTGKQTLRQRATCARRPHTPPGIHGNRAASVRRRLASAAGARASVAAPAPHPRHASARPARPKHPRDGGGGCTSPRGGMLVILVRTHSREREEE